MATIVEFDGATSQVVRSMQLSSFPALKFIPVADEISKETSVVADTTESSAGSPAVPAGTLLTSPEIVDIPVREIEEFIRDANIPIFSSVLFVSPEDLLSFNLGLPFKDPKSLAKVLDMEVQDILPFDINGLLLQHRIIAPLKDGLTDIHVSAIGREYIQGLLDECRSQGVEPVVISTPGSVIASLFDLLKFPDNAILLYPHGDKTHCSVRIDSIVRTERTLPDSTAATFPTELSRYVSSLQRRYSTSGLPIFLLGSETVARFVSRAIGVEVAAIALPEDSAPGQLIATMGAAFGQEDRTNEALTNFRAREFSYSPLLRETVRGIRAAMPYSLLFAAALIFASIGTYVVRVSAISKLHREATQKVHSVIPNLPTTEGEELKALQKENQQLEQQLKELGSPAFLNPLDALVVLSNDFANAGFALRKVSIRGNRVSLEGTAPNYAAVDNMEHTLRKKSQIYCRVKKDSESGSSGSADKRGFGFDIWLCD